MDTAAVNPKSRCYLQVAEIAIHCMMRIHILQLASPGLVGDQDAKMFIHFIAFFIVDCFYLYTMISSRPFFSMLGWDPRRMSSFSAWLIFCYRTLAVPCPNEALPESLFLLTYMEIAFLNTVPSLSSIKNRTVEHGLV